MVTTVSEECTRRILALQEKEKDEIYLLKQEKQHLLKFIDNMKEEKSSLQTQVEYLQASVAEEYTRYLDQHDAHKLLLAKLNEMHRERLDMTRRQAQDMKGEDVVKLTLALKVARQDLTKAQVKLNKMIADYGDVVPRRDFESLEKKYSDLLQEGKGGNVPVYLRHEGEVKNKKLTKKDVVSILKDIWKEKIALEQQTGKRSSLPEFFLSYLQKKFGDAAAMEWSYTLYENMRLCRSNHVLSSFYAILTGKDEEGNATPFVAKLRSQYVREKQEYLRQLKNKLGDLTEGNADDLKAAFCSIDPDIDDQTLETYLGLALRAGGEEPEQGAVAVETALERLLAGDVRRVGPAPREGSTASSEGE
ncbi:translin-associated factor x-interacting protein 1 [Limosa lapponica baueri]|uniref:Translin-associated factor x-interacting protein 1 n=1 Tax=Limosa lapponica baueri TaxID=1758121 RepID=A0A2I0TAH2_LIMLA|nr:translin-associated factor x-interacting protein 1 [Limosa lapponica baueri]